MRLLAPLPAFGRVTASAASSAPVSSCAGDACSEAAGARSAGAEAAGVGDACAGSTDVGGFLGVLASARGCCAFTPLAPAMPSSSL